ncbi:TonB-dependent hemoglobin/transferrin/lactoferrin family receptor [Photobacterium sp. ZSDE20]|uniref:TonB-dependent hemoglobin/transferrin/lactoferrin family receptor n=1 Tax=Photobacterium pectinilyticum TaxID=2906793 RepID=A0ABT1N4R6_9GAMM|nr:TonB-dependent hemoglobin/transferrin/lactoferrin family receptor [Photobacterium sp. ZSDE20]MCQ1058721.1 TonB-dependent hemoglobin/transferrin/lactoferrin family receptor [Photobacterium sp. ZSDE20]MDD1823503.1 TonB-dependent hemoglobin/transferrin/lactoferrin family receptor [Photobacterium sp. ZSDE20]
MENKLTLVASAVVVALSPAVHAQQDISIFDEIVVAESRAVKTEQDKTRSIERVNRDQLDEAQPNSVAEAVKFEPNVSVAGANVPGNQSVNIRGLQGNKVLQIIDGTRQNIQYGHRPSYFLDPALISDIEVVKGPISSLYGSGAIGGVVVQNTLTADDILDDDGLGGRVRVGYQDNGDVWSNTAAIASKNGNIDWLIGGSYQDAGIKEQGDGTKLYGSEATNKTGLAKLNWQINEAHKAGINFRYADLDGRPPVVGDSSGQLNDPDLLIKRRTTDQSVALDYGFNPANELIKLEVALFHNDTEIEESADGRVGDDISKIKTTGFSVTNESVAGDFKIFTGLDGYEDKLNATRISTDDSRPTPPDGSKTTTVGAFGYVNYNVFETVMLDAGIRYDTFTSEADGFDDNDESAWSPSVGARWQAQPWMAWSIRYDEAFRAPNTTELYMDGTHFSFGEIIPGMGEVTNSFTPNAELKPEKSQNIEIRGEFNFEQLLGDDELTITAAAFRNKVEDFINLEVVVPEFGDIMQCVMMSGSGAGCAGTSKSSNIDNAELEGYEIAADYRYQSLLLGLSYGQTRGKNTDTNEWLSNIPADKWVAQAEYGFWDIDTKVGTRAIFASDQKRTPASDSQGPYKGYELVDFYVSWEPTSQLEGLKLDFAVNNAFDKNYRTPWTSVYQPGRSFRLAAQYTF